MPFVNAVVIKASGINAVAARALRWSGRSGPAIRRLPGLAFVVLALGLAGCSLTAYDEAGENGVAENGAAEATDPAEDLAFGDLGPDDEASPDKAKRVPLTPEEIAAFEMPPVPTPDELPLAIDEERSEAVLDAAASEDLEIMAAAAIDPTPTKEEIEAWGDGLPRTENGRLISLDESASVACANIEMTIWAMDGGDSETASDRLTKAVSLVNESTSEGVQSWLPLLEAQSGAEAIDPLVLVGFLEACVAAGHDL